MKLFKNFRDQFVKPEGLLGRLAGFLMYWAGREKNRWTLSLLKLQKEDHVLEIGFGPGVAIHMAAQKVPKGLVVGIDYSEIMVRQALKRNRAAVEAGRVQLLKADVNALPTFSTTFDKVFSVNSIIFWREPSAVLKAIRQQMNPNGLIAVTVQPYEKGATRQTAEEIGAQIVDYLKQAGFSQIRMELKEMKPAPAVCVLGVNLC